MTPDAATTTATATAQQQQQQDDEEQAGVYCFGYGPMVNPIVRQRRGVHTIQEQAAILPEYRLTFAFGGVASVVPQRGYDVHGIVMKCQSAADWDKIQQFEAGYYAQPVQVYGYNDNDNDDSDSDAGGPVPIQAYVLIMLDYDESKLEKIPIEKLPQERYLRLLVDGMRRYGLDEDYIQDQILAVPFVPSRKPSQYQTFPAKSTPLPKITYERYQRLCQDDHNATTTPTTPTGLHNHHNNKQQPNTDNLYFIVGHYVILIGEHDPHHPGTMWFRENGLGQPDVTFVLHQTVVDPDIPFCATADEITASTQAWAENHLVEFISQCGFSAQRVMELSQEEEEADESGSNGSVDSGMFPVLVDSTRTTTTTTPQLSSPSQPGRRRGSRALRAIMKRMSIRKITGNGKKPNKKNVHATPEKDDTATAATAMTSTKTLEEPP